MVAGDDRFRSRTQCQGEGQRTNHYAARDELRGHVRQAGRLFWVLAKDIVNEDDPRLPLTAAQFLAKAWKLANEKARELGWIV